MRIRLGVSACLLGQEVRYDGQHKLDRFLVETLGKYVDYVPVCPEVECGLGVPREAMRLVGDPEAPRLVTQTTKKDLTKQMLDWVARRLDELAGENLSGFIFKSKSPSSGMERVKIYNEEGAVVARGAGLFARAFIKRFPLLPVEDEGRLSDPDLRENFIERIFALGRYRDAMAGGASLDALMRFHASQKYLLMAHSEVHARKLGKMLAGGKGRRVDLFRADYERVLLEALRLNATPRKHVNVLQHMMGYFKSSLAGDEKQELLTALDDFKKGLIPLIVPITLIRHYVMKYRVTYLAGQIYLQPHPLELNPGIMPVPLDSNGLR